MIKIFMILSLFYHNNTISLKVESSRLLLFLKIMEWIHVEPPIRMQINLSILLESRRWSHPLGFFLLYMWLIMSWCEFSSINILASQDLVWFVFNIRDLGWLYIQIEFLLFCNIVVWKMFHLNSFCYYLLIKCISHIL